MASLPDGVYNYTDLDVLRLLDGLVVVEVGRHRPFGRGPTQARTRQLAFLLLGVAGSVRHALEEVWVWGGV